MKKNYGIWLGGFLLVVAAVAVVIGFRASSNSPAQADDTIVTERCGELRPVIEPFEACIDPHVITDEQFEKTAEFEVKKARGGIEKPDYSAGAYMVDSFRCSRNAWHYEIYQDGKYPDGTLINKYIDDCDPGRIEATPTAGPVEQAGE